MKTDDMKKAGDVLLADTSPASSGSLYSCELCSLPASYLHLSVSNATHSRNSHSSNKLQIPANRRPKTLWNAVEIISWIISISAWSYSPSVGLVWSRLKAWISLDIVRERIGFRWRSLGIVYGVWNRFAPNLHQELTCYSITFLWITLMIAKPKSIKNAFWSSE